VFETSAGIVVTAVLRGLASVAGKTGTGFLPETMSGCPIGGGVIGRGAFVGGEEATLGAGFWTGVAGFGAAGSVDNGGTSIGQGGALTAQPESLPFCARKMVMIGIRDFCCGSRHEAIALLSCESNGVPCTASVSAVSNITVSVGEASTT
jgi:hypothetical protein